MLLNSINKYIPPIINFNLNYFRHLVISKKYENLLIDNLKYKNLHNGSRCFIIGSGKSILKEELSKLSEEAIITVNNLFKHDSYKEFMSNSKLKYHLIAPIHSPQTEDDWHFWFQEMEVKIPSNVNLFFGLNNYKYNIQYIKNKYGLFHKARCNWFYSCVDTSNLAFTNKPNFFDFTKLIWRSNSAGIYALLLAKYLGFSEIYLLGMDHNYICSDIDNYRFYNSSEHQIKENIEIDKDTRRKENLLKATSEIFQQYRFIKENTSSKIYNCSNESLLDIFEYKNLKEIL